MDRVRSSARDALEGELFAQHRQALEELRATATAQQQVRSGDTSRARALERRAAERAGPPAASLRPEASSA